MAIKLYRNPEDFLCFKTIQEVFDVKSNSFMIYI
jgi:hypothetical protein